MYLGGVADHDIGEHVDNSCQNILKIGLLHHQLSQGI